MLNEKVDIVVYGRKLTVEIEGLTQLELHSIAEELTERMKKLAAESQIVDSSKLGVLVALDTMIELARIKGTQENFKRAEERALEQMIVALQHSLEQGK